MNPSVVLALQMEVGAGAERERDADRVRLEHVGDFSGLARRHIEGEEESR